MKIIRAEICTNEAEDKRIRCIYNDSVKISDGHGGYLDIYLPPKTDTEDKALVILDVPTFYVTGKGWPGVTFQLARVIYDDLIKPDGYRYDIFKESASINTEHWKPERPGIHRPSPRTSANISAVVNLENEKIKIVGLWKLSHGRKNQAVVEGSCSLVALIGEGAVSQWWK